MWELRQRLAIELIDAGYRVVAAKYHPDKPGGSHEPMVLLPEIRDCLKMVLTELTLKGSRAKSKGKK
jgi:hypothetical protein